MLRRKKAAPTGTLIATALSLLILLFLCSGAASAAETSEQASQEPTQYEELLKSLEKALPLEKENIGELKKELQGARSLEKELSTELENYRLQLTARNNLLALSETSVEDLEKAQADNYRVLQKIETEVESMREKIHTTDQSLSLVTEQYNNYDVNINKIKQDTNQDSISGKLLTGVQSITSVLKVKRELLSELQSIYTGLLNQIEGIQESFLSLTGKFTQQIKKKKKQDLIQRNTSPLAGLKWKQIQQELYHLADQVRMLFTPGFWADLYQSIWNSKEFMVYAFLLLFGLVQYLLYRLRHVCDVLRQRPAVSRYQWLCLTMQLFQRSSQLFGTVVFFTIYAVARNYYSTIPFVQVILYVLTVWLFTEWALDFLKLRAPDKENMIGRKVFFRLHTLILIVRFFAIGYIVLHWITGNESGLVFLARFLFGVTLIVWSLSTGKIVRANPDQFFPPGSRWAKALQPIVVRAGYAIFMAGFFFELTGYGNLALYWYASWGRSIIVILWGSFLFLTLRELDNGLQDDAGRDNEDSKATGHPIRWLFIRIGQLAWLVIMSVGFLLAWGAGQSIIAQFFNLLNRPIAIGGMRFSLADIGSVLLVLLFTHAVTRLLRPLMNNKILSRSGLELGVQESITTITVYVAWFLGILICLNTLGVSSTSIAVMFGALGIGLGFGLQNIFSNFVSGLILLFERPVQVGDAVEIEGIWGKVRKINVRATVVQTYDNASLIIPNSDFISKQVTNWSFRDPRVRINIEVGVAYGSDVQLVKATLLEVAEQHPRVLKIPVPDVLFTDFADSALLFKLRIWTNLNYMLSTGTEIRFEIDRLFRERNITIPFPQRDIHIYPTTEKDIKEVTPEK